MSIVSWDLLIHDVSVSFVRELGALQTRTFKKWIHYAKSGNPTIFYRHSHHYGLTMKEIAPFFQKQQLIKCHLLKTSSNVDVCDLYKARATRESKAKQSNNTVMQRKWWPTVELEPLLTEAKSCRMIRGRAQNPCRKETST